jgi:1,4-dihydroxy-2-naphthoate octaprenyltransferase
MKDKMNLKHAPPLVIWLVMIILAYVLTYINKFIQDMTTVFWMGLIGCAIGTLITFIAENKCRKKEEKNE